MNTRCKVIGLIKKIDIPIAQSTRILAGFVKVFYKGVYIYELATIHKEDENNIDNSTFKRTRSDK